MDGLVLIAPGFAPDHFPAKSLKLFQAPLLALELAAPLLRRGFAARALHPETIECKTDTHKRLMARLEAAAGSNPMQTGFLSMRLGLINFILPFLFVINPTLILRGDPMAILHNVSTALIAVWLMACAFEGYLHGVGRINIVSRAFLLIGAGFLLVPGLYTDMAGATAIVLGYLSGRLMPVREPSSLTSD